MGIGNIPPEDHHGDVARQLDIDEEPPDSPRESGFWAALGRAVDAVNFVNGLCGVLVGFVLAAFFFYAPFTDLGQDGPWYFWVGSGVIAFTVGMLLTWILMSSGKG